MTRFVLLAAPRTGSNWLCTLLDSHPEVVCHHELFNPTGIHLARSFHPSAVSWANTDERERNVSGWLTGIWADHRDCRAVGFKLNRGQSPAAFSAVLGDPAVRKILLSRANVVETYLSERRAEATGYWESYLEDPEPPPAAPTVLDADDLARHIETNRRYFDELHAALSATSQTYCRVQYEELDDPATHRRLLAYLGVDPNVRLRAGTRKLERSLLPAGLNPTASSFVSPFNGDASHQEEPL